MPQGSHAGQARSLDFWERIHRRLIGVEQREGGTRYANLAPGTTSTTRRGKARLVRDVQKSALQKFFGW